MPNLIIRNGHGEAERYGLNAGHVTIGRHPESTFVFEHGSVSTRHAEIIAVDGAYTVRDLGSSNGTTVNGQPIRETTLKDGDIICFGPVECRFENPLIEGPSGAGIPKSPCSQQPAETKLPPPLPPPAALPPREFCKPIKNGKGRVIGLWVTDPYDSELGTRVAEFNAQTALPSGLFKAFGQGRYRVVPNESDEHGGAFLMFDSTLAPGELPHPKPASSDVVHISCQKCQRHYPPQEIRRLQGRCADPDCSGEVWTLKMAYQESYTKTAPALFLVNHLAWAVDQVLAKRVTEMRTFAYPDIDRQTILFLAGDDARVYERAVSFGLSRSQQKRLERGAQYCRACGALYENVVDEPWFALGCCSKSCSAQVSDGTDGEMPGTAPVKKLRAPIAMTCPNGHAFEVAATFSGCNRPCPECGAKCAVPEFHLSDLSAERIEGWRI
jgi:hypothetical protein